MPPATTSTTSSSGPRTRGSPTSTAPAFPSVTLTPSTDPASHDPPYDLPMPPPPDRLPVGRPLPRWRPPPPPPWEPAEGRFCQLRPVDPERDAPQLVEPLVGGGPERWTYLAFDPPADEDALRRVLTANTGPERMGFVIEVGGRGLGLASYLRVQPEVGSLEVGGIVYGDELARTAAATEAMFLMADRAFATGYRRYEWKCDALNLASRRAATRLGFTFEGVWKHALVTKGRNRDTAWYSITDDEWPTRRAALTRWLDTALDADGRQLRPLRELQDWSPRGARSAQDPS